MNLMERLACLPEMTGDPAEDNNARAERAELALYVGTDYDGEDENDRETYAADLVANLRHLCAREGVDWDEVTRRAEMHYGDERAEAGLRS